MYSDLQLVPCARTCAHMRAHAHVCTYIRMHACTYTRMQAHMYAHMQQAKAPRMQHGTTQRVTCLHMHKRVRTCKQTKAKVKGQKAKWPKDQKVKGPTAKEKAKGQKAGGGPKGPKRPRKATHQTRLGVDKVELGELAHLVADT